MKVLVCGGRDYNDAERMHEELTKLSPEFVVQGGYAGADILAKDWCLKRAVACATFYAAWDSPLGRAAGPVRNGWMLFYTPKLDLVLAFPGGDGTASMVKLAENAGITVRHVTP